MLRLVPIGKHNDYHCERNNHTLIIFFLLLLMNGDDDNRKSAKVALLLNLKQLLLINLFHLPVLTRALRTAYLHMPTQSCFALHTNISNIQLNHIHGSAQLPQITSCHVGPCRSTCPSGQITTITVIDIIYFVELLFL